MKNHFYIWSMLVVLASGCALKDDQECFFDIEPACEIEGSTYQVRKCVEGKYVRSFCANGCFEGACLDENHERWCQPDKHEDMCVSPTALLLCVEQEDQPGTYIKSVVECEDGACNTVTRKCDKKSGIGNTCKDKVDYCDETNPTISHYCIGGIYYMHDCNDEGLTCMGGRCVQAPQCNPIDWKTDCVDKHTVQVCNKYGQLEGEPCGESMECDEGICKYVHKYEVGQSCDPDIFSTHCVGDVWYQCQNGIVTIQDCQQLGGDSPYICENPGILDQGVGCYPTCTTPGKIAGRSSCSRLDGKFSYKVCATMKKTGRNVQIEQLVPSACFGDSLVSCYDGDVRMTRCAADCVESTALGYSVYCEEMIGNCKADDVFACKDLNTKLECDPKSLTTKEVTCQDNERCSLGECVSNTEPPVAGEYCDVAHAKATCLDSGVMVTCNDETGLYELLDCADYAVSYDKYASVVQGTCETFKNGDKTEAACAVACSGSTCLNDQIYDNSCLDGKFMHLSSVVTSQGATVNRITEMLSQCDMMHRLVTCNGSEMSYQKCDNACVETSLTTAKCRE